MDDDVHACRWKEAALLSYLPVKNDTMAVATTAV
jgi:hypothetical protein